MRGRGALVAVSALLVIAIGIIVFLALGSPQTPGGGRDASGARTPASHDAKPGKAETFNDVRKLYENAATEKDRAAARAAILNRETTETLAEVAGDEKASTEDRQIAFEMLSSARAPSGVLFSLAVQLSAEKDPALASRATEALSSMLLREEKLPDEAKAAEILAAAAKPHNDSSSRRAAARGLAQLKSKEAVEALVGLLSDEDSLARRFALEGLKKLSGDTFGYDYRVKPEAQKEALAKWKAWAEAYEPGTQ